MELGATRMRVAFSDVSRAGHWKEELSVPLVCVARALYALRVMS